MSIPLLQTLLRGLLQGQGKPCPCITCTAEAAGLAPWEASDPEAWAYCHCSPCAAKHPEGCHVAPEAPEAPEALWT